MPPQRTLQTSRRSLDTISVWALLATLIASLFMFSPSVAIPFVETKTFLLAAGALITLALYILARLARGNIIFPPSVLIGALWLPVIAYALSATFSGVSFGNALWGSALEPDTLGFMLVVAVLGTLAALVLRRAEHYRTYLRANSYVFCIVVALEILILIVGQFVPDTISPSFSIVGSYMTSHSCSGSVLLARSSRFVFSNSRNAPVARSLLAWSARSFSSPLRILFLSGFSSLWSRSAYSLRR